MSRKNGHIEDKLAYLELGVIVTRYYIKKKPIILTFKIRQDTNQLILLLTAHQKPCATVNISDIKEIRLTRDEGNSMYIKEFDKYPLDKQQYSLSILYGKQFVLKHLLLQAGNSADFEVLHTGLQYLVERSKTTPFLLAIERWLRREFDDASTGLRRTTSFTEIKKWVQKSYMKVPREKLRECFTRCGQSPDGELYFEGFQDVYKSLIYPAKLTKEFFDRYLTPNNIAQSGSIVTQDRLAAFFTSENHVPQYEANQLARDILSTNKTPGISYFTSDEFMSYLFSASNSLYDPNTTDRVYQDMSRPISHYFIASSHNTYLQGDQFKSNSSLEAYVQCLEMGAKCIELDCWDGPDGLPYIYHGHTLTSKIRFLDVLKTIKQYAWCRSDFPLILSIENHCCLQQQKNMATRFNEVFGDELLTKPVNRTADTLPSPLQLKRKIILKHKKLTGESDWKLLDDSADLTDISQSRKNGILYIKDLIDPDEWNPHYFVLSDTSLTFTAQTNEDEVDDEEDDNMSVSDMNGSIDPDRSHIYQSWFHGKLPGDGKTAEALLQNSNLGPAAFLVRESGKMQGAYTLSFWQHEKANHCRIKPVPTANGRTKYCLVENLTFDTLEELINHYKSNNLRSSNFEMCLGEPVPRVASPIGKPWYCESVDRPMAEDWLSRISKNGAFLVRPKETTENDKYRISFRADNKIKHCRIFLEGGQFMIGSASFESLPELVSYYQKYPLYRRMRLRYAVNQAVVESCGSDESNAAIYGCEIYTQPNEVQPRNQFRALYDYTAKRADELSFRQGDIISNVAKNSVAWWQGDCHSGEYIQARKWFPSNYVEDMEDVLGSLQQGSIDINAQVYYRLVNTMTASCSDSVEDKSLHIIEIVHSEGVLEVATDNPKELPEWIEALTQVREKTTSGIARAESLQKRFQIAQQLSDLIIYCRSTPYNPASESYYDMTSFSETKAEKICTKKDSKGRQFLQFNVRQLSRVYPKGPRIDSSNYDPVTPWCFGSHMLALNYQTPDKAMQINQGHFAQNGLCGYVLKPDCFLDPAYDPFDKDTLNKTEPITLSLIILAGRHLFKDGKGIPSPFVEVEILGSPGYEVMNKYKTKNKQLNGLMPIWNETTDFDIENPDFAFIRFCVLDEDVFGDPNFIGHATIPISCLRPGYRSVPLLNDYSNPLELSSLLVKIDIANSKDSQDPEIYAALSSLKNKKLSVLDKITEAEASDEHQITSLREQLDHIENSIDEKLEYRRRSVRPGYSGMCEVYSHIDFTKQNEPPRIPTAAPRFAMSRSRRSLESRPSNT